MSTDKVDAREAWINAGDAFLWSMAAVYSNPSSSIAERAEALNCAARHLRTTPEGYVLVPVKPVARMLYWLGKKIETFPHNRIVRTFAEFPKPKEPSKYWREGEPLYMVAPEAIDNAAQEGK